MNDSQGQEGQEGPQRVRLSCCTSPRHASCLSQAGTAGCRRDRAVCPLTSHKEGPVDRSPPPQTALDGACQNIVELRYRSGKKRPTALTSLQLAPLLVTCVPHTSILVSLSTGTLQWQRRAQVSTSFIRNQIRVAATGSISSSVLFSISAVGCGL